MTSHSEWRHIKKLIAQRTDLEDKLQRKTQYNHMIHLKNLRNRSLPFYYVDLDPKRLDELKKMVKNAKDP